MLDRRPFRSCSATLTMTLAIAFATSGASAAEPSTKAADEEARTHFSAGVNLLKDPARPRYDEAYIEFKKAYSLVSSPKILGNLGLCAMKLERDAEAIDAFTRYLSDVPDLPADERTQVERDLATLKATLATVSVDSKPTGLTLLDTRVPAHGEPVTNSYGPFTRRTDLSIRKGHHIFKGRFEGGREVTWEADITGGEANVFEAPGLPSTGATSSNPKIEPLPERRPVPTSVFVTGGIAAALAIGSLVTGLVALDKRSSFDDRNDGYHAEAATELRDTGTTLNVVSDVLVVGTVIAAGVTTYLFVTRPSASRTTRSAVRTPLTVRF